MTNNKLQGLKIFEQLHFVITTISVLTLTPDDTYLPLKE